jgi:hypothetical protein
MKRNPEMMICPEAKRRDMFGSQYSPHCVKHEKTEFCKNENLFCYPCVPVKAKAKKRRKQCTE